MTKKKDPTRPGVMQCDVRVSIHVRLTAEEAQQRALEASRLVTEVVKKKEEFADMKDDLGKEIKGLEAQVTTLAKVASTSREIQTVECQQHFDVKKRQTWYSYRDEEYERRPMSDSEYEKCTMRPLFNDGPDVANRIDRQDVTVEAKPADVVPLKKDPPKKLPDAIANASSKKKKGKHGVAPAADSLVSHAERSEPAESEERTEGSTDTEIRDVMRDETSRRGKVDIVSE